MEKISIAEFNFKPKKKKPVLKKNMNWGQAKSRYPKLSPFGDADKDGVKNWLDCKPFNKRRQDDDAPYLDFLADDSGEDADAEWKKLTPRQRALAEIGEYDY